MITFSFNSEIGLYDTKCDIHNETIDFLMDTGSNCTIISGVKFCTTFKVPFAKLIDIFNKAIKSNKVNRCSTVGWDAYLLSATIPKIFIQDTVIYNFQLNISNNLKDYYALIGLDFIRALGAKSLFCGQDILTYDFSQNKYNLLSAESKSYRSEALEALMCKEDDIYNHPYFTKYNFVTQQAKQAEIERLQKSVEGTDISLADLLNDL